MIMDHKRLSRLRKRMGRVRFKSRRAALLQGKFRLIFSRSNKNLYLQLVDDVKGIVLLSCSTVSKDFAEKFAHGVSDVGATGKVGNNACVRGANVLGEIMGNALKQMNCVSGIIFDRGSCGYSPLLRGLLDSIRSFGVKI